MVKAYAAAGAALVGLGVIGYLAAKQAGVLPGANTFNPLSPDNLAYRGANSVFSAVSGNTTDTIGTWLASGYSDSVGAAITAPVPLSDLNKPRAASVEQELGLTPFMKALFGV